MRAEKLHEALARDRHRYERLVYRRLRGGIGWQDAEDIVSDALLRAQFKASSDPPQPGKEQAWFVRLVFNQGIDFLRARDGRRRDGARPRPDVVSLAELAEAGVEPAAGEIDIDDLDDAAERAEVQAIVSRVLQQMTANDAELVRLRHVAGAGASREKVATMAGLTVGEFRWRYTKAWTSFVDAVAAEAPTPKCKQVRLLIGQVSAGSASATAAAEIDAHVLGCVSCRVFARDSYRALELLPVFPAAGFAEHWVSHLIPWVDRPGTDAAVGTGTGAAVGVGASGIAGGGAVGALKLVGTLCAGVATASTCGALLLSGALDGGAKGTAPKAAATAKRPIRPPAPPISTMPIRQQRNTRPPTPPTPPPPKPEAPIPAPAPAGSKEFEPSGSNAPVKPAPAPVRGGGEFAP